MHGLVHQKPKHAPPVLIAQNPKNIQSKHQKNIILLGNSYYQFKKPFKGFPIQSTKKPWGEPFGKKTLNNSCFLAFAANRGSKRHNSNIQLSRGNKSGC